MLSGSDGVVFGGCGVFVVVGFEVGGVEGLSSILTEEMLRNFGIEMLGETKIF